MIFNMRNRPKCKQRIGNVKIKKVLEFNYLLIVLSDDATPESKDEL